MYYIKNVTNFQPKHSR